MDFSCSSTVETETWKAVVGYEGLYEVSDCGRVRSIRGVRRKGRVLKPYANRDGHLTVAIHKNGKQKNLYVHRLILIAFVGPSPNGEECCHNDGCPANNNLTNLRWGTHRSNLNDRGAHGTLLLGSNHSSAKLTEADVLKIRELLASGHAKTEIAKQFGVVPSNISSIATGRTWSHIK